MIPQAEFRSNQLVFTHLVTGISSGGGGIFLARHTGCGAWPSTLPYSGYRGISGDKAALACTPLGVFLARYRLKFVADISFGVYSVSAAFGNCSPPLQGSIVARTEPAILLFFSPRSISTLFSIITTRKQGGKITKD